MASPAENEKAVRDGLEAWARAEWHADYPGTLAALAALRAQAEAGERTEEHGYCDCGRCIGLPPLHKNEAGMERALRKARAFVADEDWTGAARLWQDQVLKEIDAALPAREKGAE